MITGLFFGTFNLSYITDTIREIFALLDTIVYALLGGLYTVFFNVASANFLSGSRITGIYSRVQLILGVFMMFKLAVTIMQGIMDPTKVSDKKAGYGTIVGRIIVSLVMLTIITPIDIPETKNSWEEQLKSNGLAFGTLYSLQERILANNTIGLLILGKDGSLSSESTTPSKENLTDIGQNFSKTILKSFITINLISEDKWPDKTADIENAEANEELWVCEKNKIPDGVIETYSDNESTFNDVLSIVNQRCNSKGGFLKSLLSLITNEQYVFNYMYGISTIVGIILCILIMTYTLDVAIRAIKLMILRMIAPIPIISHMSISGKESKGQDSFSIWINALVTTYLELFIRLIVMYLVIFVAEIVLDTGISGSGYYSGSNWFTNFLSTIFVVLGLFFFGKQAPKFIQDSLGIKPSGGSIGLAIAAAGLGTLRGGGGAKEAWSNMREAGRAAQNGGKDPESGHAYGTGLSAYRNARDTQISSIKDGYDKGLRQEYYRRGLDIDDQDAAGHKKKWWESDDANKARQNQDALDANNERYKGNWATHERATGRGTTSRAGSEQHIRTDEYPAPTPIGSHGTPPSGRTPVDDAARASRGLGWDSSGGTGYGAGAPTTSAPTTSAPTTSAPTTSAPTPSQGQDDNPPALPPQTS